MRWTCQVSELLFYISLKYSISCTSLLEQMKRHQFDCFVNRTSDTWQVQYENLGGICFSVWWHGSQTLPKFRLVGCLQRIIGAGWRSNTRGRSVGRVEKGFRRNPISFCSFDQSTWTMDSHASRTSLIAINEPAPTSSSCRENDSKRSS